MTSEYDPLSEKLVESIEIRQTVVELDTVNLSSTDVMRVSFGSNSYVLPLGSVT